MTAKRNVIVQFIILIALNQVYKNEIINNPVYILESAQYPFAYSLENYYYIFLSGRMCTINKNDRTIDIIDFQSYDQPYVWCVDKSGYYYLFTSDALLKINSRDIEEVFYPNFLYLFQTVDHVDYIQESQSQEQCEGENVYVQF